MLIADNDFTRSVHTISRFLLSNYIIDNSFKYFLCIVTNNCVTYVTNHVNRAVDTALGHAYEARALPDVYFRGRYRALSNSVRLKYDALRTIMRLKRAT